jgi:hypothetical protein
LVHWIGLTKICTKCLDEKSTEEFAKKNDRPDGLTDRCKLCYRAYEAARRRDRQEEYRAKKRGYYSANRERELAAKARYNQNPQTKGRLRTYNKKYHEENREEIRIKQAAYKRKRRREDPVFALRERLRCRVYAAIRRAQASKADSTIRLVGCTWPELKVFIEEQFEPGMTWENCGREGEGVWQVDHVFPLALVDLADPRKQFNAFNYLNLRPLWHKDNAAAGNSIAKRCKALFGPRILTPPPLTC